MIIQKKKLDIIPNKKGKIVKLFHEKIGNFKYPKEVYFSYVKYNKIKGWKLHKKQTTIISVISGKIKIVFYDKKKNFIKEFILSGKSLHQIIIPPNVWYAFKGLDKKDNIICSLINFSYSDLEQKTIELNQIHYNW